MIYLIHGADSFRSREKLNEVIAEFSKKDPNKMNLDIFDIEETNVNKIKAAAQTMGFLSPARMIVVKDLFSAGSADAKKELSDFIISLSAKPSSPDFILFEGKEIGKKGAAGGKEWTALGKKAEIFLFQPLESAKIRQWILNRFFIYSTPAKINNKSNGNWKAKIKINPGVADKLAIYTGGDLWRLDNEIKKLVLLKLNNSNETAEITDEDVEANVKSDVPTSIFTTIDALARRDKKTALKLLEEHFAEGEAPIYLFSMFVYQFSNLIKVKDMVVNRRISNPDEIARMVKMHPYVVKKTLPYAAKYNFEYLKKVYKRLLRLDFMIKKGKLGAETALEMIVVEVGNLV